MPGNQSDNFNRSRCLPRYTGTVILAIAAFAGYGKLFATDLKSIKVDPLDSKDAPRVTEHNNDYRSIPLPQLVRVDEIVSCPKGTSPVPMVVNETADLGLGRKIPKIVHLTGKSKCLTPPLLDVARRWSLEGYSFYFHDDEAVNRLLHHKFPLFRHLVDSYECIKHAGGGMFSDY